MSDENTEQKECRICYEPETDSDDPLIAPCLCDGTSKYIHVSCLNNWRHFNHNTRAWTHCMECSGEYTIINEFPLESLVIYKHFSKKTNIFLQNYVINFFLSYFLHYIDSINNYGLIKALNFGQNTPEPSIITILKEDYMAPQIFYFSFTLFIGNIIFYMYFYSNILFKIYRKKEYYKMIKCQYRVSVIYSFMFLIFYYIFVFNGATLIYFNLIAFISLCEPYVIYRLIKRHNQIILFLNNTNGETIMSFENRINPAYNIQLINQNINEEQITSDDTDSEIEIDLFEGIV